MILLMLIALASAHGAWAQFGARVAMHHWMFRPADDERSWGMAAVPGSVHADLLRLDSIPDPYVGAVEEQLQWVGERDWLYTCHLELSDSFLRSERIEAVFPGLDTYAELRCNGQVILTADNAFRIWRADVTNLLQPGANTISILFRATAPIEAEKRRRLGLELPGGSRVYSRKAQYQYGWDWGPRYLSCGIWQMPYLQSWPGARISDLYLQTQSLSDSLARVAAFVRIEAEDSKELRIRLEVEGPVLADGKAGTRLLEEVHSFRAAKGEETIRVDFEINQPERWWCRGYGQPHRYRVRVVLESPAGDPLGQEVNYTGLRKIELVTEPDSIGRSFYFRLNGVPVYAKGANWVPTSSFPGSSLVPYRRLFAALERSNINMLRVWGGGIYELDPFYEECSRQGILVWQDFMFACGMYPWDKDFLANVKAEAIGQIERLRTYPCMALWCGNNENAEGWERWGWQEAYSARERKRIASGYEALFDEMLPQLVERLQPDVAYWPSSPQWGRGDPRFRREGDAHDWGVWHDGYPFSRYAEAVPRFMSEFGFQAWPDPRTIRWFAGAEGPLPGDPVWQTHQKHPRGDSIILGYMARDWPVPDDSSDFWDYAYISQLVQAEGMRIGLEAQRLAMPYCMGSLYWQFNDCWPVVSWSGIDYFGRWKAMQYVAERAYQPSLIAADPRGIAALELDGDSQPEHDAYAAIQTSGTVPSGGLLVAHEGRDSLHLRLDVQLLTFEGQRRYAASLRTEVAPHSVTRLWPAATDTLAQRLLRRTDTTTSVWHAILKTSDGAELLSECFAYQTKPHNLELSEPELQLSVAVENAGACILIEANAHARSVRLMSPYSGHFSDNYFDLEAGGSKWVRFTSDVWPPTDLPADFASTLELRSLYDIVSRSKPSGDDAP